MNIWKKLFNFEAFQETDQSTINSIYDELIKSFPQHDEKTFVEIACVCGLLARVAFTDMKITPEEILTTEKILKDMTFFEDDEIKLITKIAHEKIQELVDLENFLFIRPLNEIYSNDQKMKLMRLLFQVAAADGNVDNMESEEIKLISKGLLLSHEQFVQSKLTIIEHLGALKS